MEITEKDVAHLTEPARFEFTPNENIFTPGNRRIFFARTEDLNNAVPPAANVPGLPMFGPVPELARA